MSPQDQATLCIIGLILMMFGFVIMHPRKRLAQGATGVSVFGLGALLLLVAFVSMSENERRKLQSTPLEKATKKGTMPIETGEADVRAIPLNFNPRTGEFEVAPSLENPIENISAPSILEQIEIQAETGNVNNTLKNGHNP